MMPDKRVFELLREAMTRSGKSRASLCREANVDRVFLWNLLKGKVPPRAREGHELADQDERYRRMAVVLQMPDVGGFISRVVFEQRQGHPSASSMTKALGDASTSASAHAPLHHDDQPASMALSISREYRRLAEGDRTRTEYAGFALREALTFCEIAQRQPTEWRRMVDIARQRVDAYRTSGKRYFPGRSGAPERSIAPMTDAGRDLSEMWYMLGRASENVAEQSVDEARVRHIELALIFYKLAENSGAFDQPEPSRSDKNA